MMYKIKPKIKESDCPYCDGKGYFQLLLGGSETCGCCNGTGENSTE